jgi:hypothetical protein
LRPRLSAARFACRPIACCAYVFPPKKKRPPEGLYVPSVSLGVCAINPQPELHWSCWHSQAFMRRPIYFERRANGLTVEHCSPALLSRFEVVPAVLCGLPVSGRLCSMFFCAVPAYIVTSRNVLPTIITLWTVSSPPTCQFSASIVILCEVPCSRSHHPGATRPLVRGGGRAPPARRFHGKRLLLYASGPRI